MEQLYFVHGNYYKEQLSSSAAASWIALVSHWVWLYFCWIHLREMYHFLFCGEYCPCNRTNNKLMLFKPKETMPNWLPMPQLFGSVLYVLNHLSNSTKQFWIFQPKETMPHWFPLNLAFKDHMKVVITVSIEEQLLSLSLPQPSNLTENMHWNVCPNSAP